MCLTYNKYYSYILTLTNNYAKKNIEDEKGIKIILKSIKSLEHVLFAFRV